MSSRIFPLPPLLKNCNFFFKKLLKGFITQKDEIYAFVVDFLAALPADMKRFLDIAGLMGTYSSELGCED